MRCTHECALSTACRERLDGRGRVGTCIATTGVTRAFVVAVTFSRRAITRAGSYRDPATATVMGNGVHTKPPLIPPTCTLMIST